MTRYLLDADAVIGLLNDAPPAPRLVADLYRQGDTVCTCAVVTAEVFSGLAPIELPQGEELLGAMKFLRTNPAIGRQAGLWRYQFARRGVRLSAPDCLIAATAYLHHATLITGNVRHFPMTELATLRLPWG